MEILSVQSSVISYASRNIILIILQRLFVLHGVGYIYLISLLRASGASNKIQRRIYINKLLFTSNTAVPFLSGMLSYSS